MRLYRPAETIAPRAKKRKYAPLCRAMHFPFPPVPCQTAFYSEVIQNLFAAAREAADSVVVK